MGPEFTRTPAKRATHKQVAHRSRNRDDRHETEVNPTMCADCRVIETEMAADGQEETGLQVIRVHPETDVRNVTM